MAIVAMQKVAIIAHRLKKEELLQNLQEMGVLEISEATDPVTVDHTSANFRIAELQFAIDTLKDIASKETLKAIAGPANPDEVVHAAHHTDVRGIIDRLHKWEESDTAANRQLAEIEAKKTALKPWVNLPYRLDEPSELENAIRVYGFMSASKNEEFEEQITSLKVDLQVVDESPSGKAYAAIVWKGDKARFEEIATSNGWTTITLPALPGKPAELYEAASIEEKTLLQQKEHTAKERKLLSVELPKLHMMRIYMDWLSSKQAVREAAHETFATVTLIGWIERDRVAQIEEKLSAHVPEIAILKVKAEEGEEPPVLLRNNKFITPFESVTTLYGLPLASEMDPTKYLTPFFALYFALCLTDGGYGLALTLIFGAVILKTKKSVYEAQLVWLLFISGIASILVGIPFGGWFGLTPDQVPAFLTKTTADGSRWFVGQVWNLSEQEGINFLQYLSLVLGIAHIFFGVFLAGWHKWVHENKAGAFWQHFTLHILLGATLFKAFGPETMQQTATYTLYAALVLVIWGQGHGSVWYLRPIFGVLGLVNFGISLLSNGLSYLRLLALGLVTGAIALAVNQVAIEMSKLFPVFLAIPVMILIALGGHTVSLALNALGSFIHSGRLQFIEFFGQFFEGGGRPFTPFHRSNR